MPVVFVCVADFPSDWKIYFSGGKGKVKPEKALASQLQQSDLRSDFESIMQKCIETQQKGLSGAVFKSSMCDPFVFLFFCFFHPDRSKFEFKS